MRRSLWKKALVLSMLSGVAHVCVAADLAGGAYKGWTEDREVFVPMRDGVNLSTTIVRPNGAAERLPAVLVRSPYDDTSKLFGSWLWLDDYVRHGFAVVLQDQRGRGFSEGEQHNLFESAANDGADTVGWIVRQPWSNGKVGAIGCSVSADLQWPIAVAGAPGFAAMVALAAGNVVGKIPGNDTDAGFYRGGVPRLSLFASWFNVADSNERLVLPPHSNQDQRIRLRNSYSTQMLWAKDVLRRGTLDVSGYLHLPSQDILRQFDVASTPFARYISWTPADLRWNEIELINDGARPRVPALHMNTWHDHSVGETTRLFKYLQAQGIPNQYLIIGAGSHCGQTLPNEQLSDLKVGDLEFGDARYGGVDRSYAQLLLNWFDYWLKGGVNHVTEMPKVQLFVMGEGWISSDQWPLKQTRYTVYYLSGAAADPESSGTLSTRPPSGAGTDRYRYDPGSPTLSLGGSAWDEAAPARDQRPVEARRDVLTYSTPPLDRPVTVVGPVQVTLYVSSSAKDTDFMVKLVDVYPDGKAINLDNDAFRVRYREGFDRKALMQPRQVYKIVLPNMVTANRFGKGHRIQLDVASSNFPLYERNLNTGGNNYDESTWVVAENEIHHGSKYPSQVLLPVLPE